MAAWLVGLQLVPVNGGPKPGPQQRVGVELPTERPQLLTKVWGPDSDVEDGNLDNYIHFLRRRLQAVGSSLKIQTVRGVGYRLQQP